VTVRLESKATVSATEPALPPPPGPSTSQGSGSSVSRWLALAGIVALVAGLWWTRPAPDTGRPAATTEGPGASPADPAASTASMPAVTLTVATATGGGEPPTAAVPRGTAMLHLRLPGTGLPPAADLVAEIAALGRDEVKRWPVDDAPAANDGATRVVSVPPYAVPAGEYALTLWQGDADVVQRYRFRVAP
jgi:hypothetical protein